MEQTSYMPDFERFKEEHPEIDPAVYPHVQPAVTDSGEAVFSFIMSYIFM